MKRTTIILFLLLFFANIGYSQQIPIQNQFLINRFAINPSFAGFNGNTEAFINYRQNWIGIEGAPSLATANFNGKLFNNMGYGLNAMTENSGNFSQIYITGTFAYHIKFSDMVTLNFGLSPQLFRNQIDLSKVNSYGTQLDPMLQNNSGLAITAYDVGVSTAFIINNLNIGVSVPRTIGMSFKYKDTEGVYQLQRHYIMFASWNEKLSDKISITPMVLLRTTERSEFNFEVGMLARFNNKYWTAVNYRADNSIVTTVGGCVGERIVLNYSYEFGIGGLSTATSGTHELTMGFLLNRSKTRKQPTAFAPPLTPESNDDVLKLEIEISKLKSNLKKETSERNSEIERLEAKIDSLHQTSHIPNDTNNNTDWLEYGICQSISFGQNSDRLLSSAHGELNKFATKLKTEPELIIQIEIHTDNLGSKEYKQKLSDDRAFAVSNYLLSKGVKSNQIVVTGKGATIPLDANDNPEARRLNNRTVIYFNKKVKK